MGTYDVIRDSQGDNEALEYKRELLEKINIFKGNDNRNGTKSDTNGNHV